ncbi:hypothetical protein LIER_23718 [Lithospermum erythrorhizon]|uniref:Uncharacterized protein n=1 Tax=Lithospermum erythrorhizon TaxID=34254 RepID=A0AAV3R264_LITER
MRVEEPVINPTPIKSIPPPDTTQRLNSQPPIFYLSWIDTSGVQDAKNPRPEVEGRDVDVGGDEPTTVNPTEGDSIGEAISPIEGRVDASSHVEGVEVANLLELTSAPVVLTLWVRRLSLLIFLRSLRMMLSLITPKGEI